MPWKDPRLEGKLRVLDLFSGLESVTKGFRERGHIVTTLDFDPQFEADLIEDIRTWDWEPYVGAFEVVWASPPCETFSVASNGTHWTGGERAYVPKTDKAVVGMDILTKTVRAILGMEPKLWFMENPKGMMRKMSIVQRFGTRHTTAYCQYGDTRKKPTDIWSNSRTLSLEPECKNITKAQREDPNFKPCHEPSPRGARTGTQGMKNAALRAVIPEKLVHEIVLVCEDEI